jgi:hypothetical protein
MTKSPQYPIEVAGTSGRPGVEESKLTAAPPPDLHFTPSFKHRREIREPLENCETSYYRAYPHLAPRRVSSRQARRQAIRNGG